MKKLMKKVQATGAVFVQGGRDGIGSTINTATIIVAAGLGAINENDNRVKGAFDAAIKQAALCYAIDGVQHVVENRKLIKELTELGED